MSSNKKLVFAELTVVRSQLLDAAIMVMDLDPFVFQCAAMYAVEPKNYVEEYKDEIAPVLYDHIKEGYCFPHEKVDAEFVEVLESLGDPDDFVLVGRGQDLEEDIWNWLPDTARWLVYSETSPYLDLDTIETLIDHAGLTAELKPSVPLPNLRAIGYANRNCAVYEFYRALLHTIPLKPIEE